MRLLFLCHFFPPQRLAGAENYTLGIARALVAAGHTVYVLCAGTWDSGADYWNGYTDEVYEGIHVRRLNLCWYKAPDPNRYLYDNPVTAAHLRTWLDEIHPDIVHAISCYTLSASVLSVVKEAGLPLVMTLVDFWFLCPNLHLLRSDGALCEGQTTPWECLKCELECAEAKAYRWPAAVLPERLVASLLLAVSERSILNRVVGLRGLALNMAERKRVLSAYLQQPDVILCPSECVASLHREVMGDLPIRLQPYGHDLAWLAHYSPQRSNGDIRFGYVGQIAEEKGVHTLLQAFLELGETSRVSLDVWGRLDLKSRYGVEIQALAARSAQVRLRGTFSRAQLGEVLSEVDVLVVPSIWYENNPLTIQEAFAAGIPVIASDLGGMSEFVQHEVNGLLFERGNVTHLAGQMRRVMDEPYLPDQLRAGIPRVRSIEEELQALTEIYLELIGGSSGAA